MENDQTEAQQIRSSADDFLTVLHGSCHVRPSVLPQVTETAGVRSTARLADRPEFVAPRIRSRSPDGAARFPRLHRPLDIAISVPQGMLCVHCHLLPHRLRHPYQIYHNT